MFREKFELGFLGIDEKEEVDCWGEKSVVDLLACGEGHLQVWFHGIEVK